MIHYVKRKNRSLRFIRSDKALFFSYFIVHIIIGTFVLYNFDFWKGEGSLSFIDSLFTTVSAICVTGLITVDTAQFSMAGQLFILYLIQAGGLGIITFSMLYLFIPGIKLSINSSQNIKSYIVGVNDLKPKQIVRMIILFTFLIEIIGGILLSIFFYKEGVDKPIFSGFFHSVSAFCNGGFSVFSDSVVSFQTNWAINLTLIFLIITGGIGFMVIWDIARKIRDKRNKLHFHTKLMLLATPILLIVGFLLYMLVEYNGALKDFTLSEKVLVSIFQSTTTRTAGFNSIDFASLSLPSQLGTFVLMLIGGGSGSTAGGLKVSTAFILLIVIFKGLSDKREIRLFNRRISKNIIYDASMFFMKAMAILFTALFLLTLVESNNPDTTLISLTFEIFSAIGTVGVSHGITGLLSTAGKVIIIFTMFAGRVALFALVIPKYRRTEDRYIDYPKGEVLIG